jgi:metal-responsive CopG/Arc/MetJ family transcriptional regulator
MDEVVMVTSIELSEQELAELRDLTQQSDSMEAIRVAMRDYIRYARRMRLKQLSGQVEMTDNWRQLEESEVGSVLTTDPHFDLIAGLKRFPLK